MGVCQVVAGLVSKESVQCCPVCHLVGEGNRVARRVNARKAVLHTEYVDDWADAQSLNTEVCGANPGFSAIVKGWDLGPEFMPWAPELLEGDHAKGIGSSTASLSAALELWCVPGVVQAPGCGATERKRKGPGFDQSCMSCGSGLAGGGRVPQVGGEDGDLLSFGVCVQRFGSRMTPSSPSQATMPSASASLRPRACSPATTSSSMQTAA